MIKGVTKPYKFGNKLFRYNNDTGSIEWVYKVDSYDEKRNKKYEKSFGNELYQVGKDGYVVVDSERLDKEIWAGLTMRKHYLKELANKVSDDMLQIADDKNFEILLDKCK